MKHVWNCGHLKQHAVGLWKKNLSEPLKNTFASLNTNTYPLSCFLGLNRACYKLQQVDFWHRRLLHHSGQRPAGKTDYCYWNLTVFYSCNKIMGGAPGHSCWNLPGDSSYLCLQQKQTSGPQNVWSEKDTELFHQPKQDGRSPGTGPLGLHNYKRKLIFNYVGQGRISFYKRRLAIFTNSWLTGQHCSCFSADQNITH